MRKITMYMMGVMVVAVFALGGCSEYTSKKDIAYTDDSVQKDIKEEKPVEKTEEDPIEEEITSPEYYLATWEDDKSVEVTYNEELKQFDIVLTDTEGLARIVETTLSGHRPAREKWNQVVESHKKISSLMEDEYRVAIKHPTDTGYLLIVQGGEVIYDYMNK